MEFHGREEPLIDLVSPGGRDSPSPVACRGRRKLAIYAGIGGYEESFEERLALIKEVGFHAVCLNFERDMERTETPWPNQVELCRKYGLPVQAAHLTGTGMTKIWDDGSDAETITERTVREVVEMKACGVDVGVVHVTWGHDLPSPPSANALRRFERIASAAEQCGAVVALENSVSADHLRYALDNIASPHLGFCYDSGHENAFTPGENYLERYGDRLAAMHLHGNDGLHDNHFPPFHDGDTIDWGKKVAQLKNTALFREYVILESGYQRGLSLRDFLAESFTAAVRLSEM